MAGKIRLAATVIAGLLTLAGPAAAEIFLTPLRQVITPAAPTATYEISNPTQRIVDVRLRLVDFETEGEGYKPAGPAFRAAHSAAPFLEVRPAFVRLEPGARARISVRLGKSKKPPPGERRSHLLMEADAVRTPLRKAGGLEADVGLGVSTPVILRNAPADASAAFLSTKLLRDEEGFLEIATEIGRTGRASTYGRLTASLHYDGATRPVARRDNVAVFADRPSRKFALPLNLELLPGGSILTLRYEGAAEYEGVIFAEKSFEISPPK